MKIFENEQIVFLQGIEEFDAYPEAGMKATVVAVEELPEEGLFEIFLDYSKYEEHNSRLETHRFVRDKRMVTARELGEYEVRESYVLTEAASTMFEIVDEHYVLPTFFFDRGVSLIH